MTVYTVKEWQAQLAQAGRELNPLAVRTMNRAAGNIKRDWRTRAAGANPVHAAKYSGSIVMRRTMVSNGEVTITVEPGGRGQGKLGAILEHGGPHNAAQRSNTDALAEELPNLLKWLAKIAVKPLQ